MTNMELNQFGLPHRLPKITIEDSFLQPFAVKNQEMRWWFGRPVLGEVTHWGCYDYPTLTLAKEITRMECTGEAIVHGIQCHEIKSENFVEEEKHWNKTREITFYINQTEDFTRTIATIEKRAGKHEISSFYDEAFIDNWGEEEPILIKEDGKLVKNENGNYLTAYGGIMLCGRSNVKIAEKVFDCIRVFDILWHSDPVRSILKEGYITQEGRTILSRRYNAPMWSVSESGRYQLPWTEVLPQTNRVVINDIEFVHWYDTLSNITFATDR